MAKGDGGDDGGDDGVSLVVGSWQPGRNDHRVVFFV